MRIMTAGFDIPDISAVISREISKGESDNLEFKVSKPSKDAKYVKTAIAFANGSGGRKDPLRGRRPGRCVRDTG